jgi:hypothetical protein
MSERWKIAVVDRKKKTAQDAPGTIFSRGVATWVSPLSEHAHRDQHRSPINMLEHFRRNEDDVDAGLPVDAKNASTRKLEKCKSALFHSAHIDPLFLQEEDKKTRNERRKHLSPTVYEIGSGPNGN